ncbi:hypothetical protein AB1L42_01075 [Thalassoglobus sp. JC818]
MALLLAEDRFYLRAEGGEVLLIAPFRDELKDRGHFEQIDRSDSPV